MKKIKQLISQFLVKRETNLICRAIEANGLLELEKDKCYIVHLDKQILRRDDVLHAVREQFVTLSQRTGAVFIVAEGMRISPCE